MKLIGYWLRNLFDERFIAPQELAMPMPADLCNRVASYLDGGRHVLSYRGYSWCRYHCGANQNGSAELGDGVWCWPQGLAHYVRVHGTALPDEFIAHVLSAPALPGHLLEHAEQSLEFWIDWCAAHRNPQFVVELQHERAKAECLAEQDRLEEIAALEARHGHSASQCLFAGCERPAMSNVVYCAAHYIATGDQSDGFRLRRSSACDLLRRWTRE